MTKIAIIGDIHFGKFARSSEFAMPGERLQDNTDGASPLKSGIIEIIKKEKAEFLFVTGDLTSTGSPIEFDSCYKLVSEIAKSVVYSGDIDHRFRFLLTSHSGFY